MLNKKLNYENILWLFVIFFAISDLISTYIGLTMGLEEQNVVGIYLLDNVGFIGLILFKFLIIIFCYILSKKLMYGYWNYFTPIILCLVWFIVSKINVFLILKVY